MTKQLLLPPHSEQKFMLPVPKEESAPISIEVIDKSHTETVPVKLGHVAVDNVGDKKE